MLCKYTIFETEYGFELACEMQASFKLLHSGITDVHSYGQLSLFVCDAGIEFRVAGMLD